MTLSTSVGRQRLAARRALLAMSTILCSGFAAPSLAQTIGSVAPPSVRQPADENGVDVVRGTFTAASTDLTIGGEGSRGLSYGRQNSNGNWTDTSIGTINQSGSTVTVSVRGQSDSFTASGSTYTPTQGNGATLSKATGNWVYTVRDGTVATFEANTNYFYPVFYGPSQANAGHLTSIVYPDGVTETYTYKEQQYCGSGFENGSCPSGTKYIVRLQSLNSSNGYQLKFTYASNATEVTAANFRAWAIPASVSAINSTLATCAPAADSCAATAGAPTTSYSSTTSGAVTTTLVTDSASRVTRYTRDAGANGSFKIKRPGASTDNIIVLYGASTGMVSSLTRDGVSFGYAYADSGTTRTTTVTDPNGGQRVYTSNTTTFLISKFRDEMGSETVYAHDANGRLTQVTSPEGNSATITYDGRGNVTQRTATAKPGSGGGTITTLSGFAATCANAKTCNQPNWTKDPKGSQTDYAYDASTGNPTTITLPAPATGAARPQTRYSYTTLSGVSLLTGVSQCAVGTAPGCVGTANETRTTIGYTSNLQSNSVVGAAGDNSVTSTTTSSYDALGNLVAIDGPLPGAADTMTFRHDAVRRQVGAISPNPDGAGALPHRAVRTTYNVDDQPTLVENGTVSGASDAAWSAFTSLQQRVSQYDANGRKADDRLTAGGTTYQVTQYSYDPLGRPECTTARLNSAAWSSLPSACTLGVAGAAGQDRISRIEYDAAGRPTKSTSAYGTADQADDARATYTANGQIATLTDGQSNRTTYEYDGFDRLLRTRFPVTTVGANSSSTTDYEELSYDANSSVTQRRLRDGQVIAFSYDLLSRPTLMDVPNTSVDSADINYSYDNLGRLLVAARSSLNQTAFTYDALGRKVSESNYYHSQSYLYDAAGRPTRMTWGDGFYVAYDYLTTGEMMAIRENGAASGAGVLAQFEYDGLGRRVSLTRGNGTTTSYAYDSVSRLASLGHDLAGTAGDVSTTYGYNPAGQIVSANRSNPAYAFSAQLNGTTGYGINGLNQAVTAGSFALGYDARGNITAIGSQTYQYTPTGRLWDAPNQTSLYADGLERLSHISASNTLLANDGPNTVSEHSYTGATGNPLLRRYVFGPGIDEPLVWYEGAGTADRRWLHADERGSIVAVSNAAGNQIAINRYDEYGAPAAGNVGRFQYTGQKWIPELGLYDYKARMYWPNLGRFMQTDPIGYGDGLNWYNYVGADPVNGKDPSGLENPNRGPYLPYDPEKSSMLSGSTILNNRSLGALGLLTTAYDTGPNGPTYAGSNVLWYPNVVDPALIRSGVSSSLWAGGTAEIGGGSGAPQKEKEEPKKDETDLEQCLKAVGTAGLEGFIDPLSIAAGAGMSIYEARERIGDGDYGRDRNGVRFPRDWGHAARLGLRRFIPGYLQASAIVGGVKGTFELFSNPACGLKK